ncbi:MAG: thiol-disulfide oxidoreductase [Bacteroidetes bacterium ADurb.BinA174]|nr:MAG: thiol-disulfide oxidoreductase [Bacteroidetes bacterium ADurb.BinA174]
MIKKRIIFIFLLPIFSFSIFSQEITKNKDESISIKTDSVIFLDSSGNLLEKSTFQDSLNTNEYIVAIKKSSAYLEIQLKKKYSDFQLGKEFPLIELIDINQNIINIKEKKLTLLTFGDITCKPCIEEITALNILAKEYPEVNFIAITSASKQNINKFLQEKGLEWNNLIISTDNQEYFKSLNIQNIPLNIIIDSSRRIKGVFIGEKIREILLSFENKN